MADDYTSARDVESLCEALIPGEDADGWSYATGLAADAGEAISSTLRSHARGEVAYAVSAAASAYEAADLYANQAPRAGTPAHNYAPPSHPVISAERERQRRDVSALRDLAAETSPEAIRSAIAGLRDRAAREPVGPTR